MCYGCWEKAGKPQMDTPLVRAAADAVAALYDHEDCGAGGNLHIVTDDWNVDDDSLAFCLYCIEHAGQMPLDDTAPEIHKRYNEQRRLSPDAPSKLAVERACHDALARLTEDERYAALALEHGLWSVGSLDASGH